MIQKTWWDFYDEDPFEKIGRYVPDTFGNPIVVSLERISWAYLDWYVEHRNGDMDLFFRENHKSFEPYRYNLDDWMEDAVRHTYLWEEKQGNPRPPWCEAAGPAEYMDIE